MKERPILFSGPMVLALLAGTKTQTRRVVGDPEIQTIRDRISGSVLDTLLKGCRYGQPGDRLWVKETFAHEERGGGMTPRLIWRADRAAAWVLPRNVLDEVFYLPSDYAPARWKPSIFMPRWASRLTLKVTEVRIQRLQEISEEDALAEGVTATPPYTARSWLHDLWNSINGERADWASNPWVWAVSFVVVPQGGLVP